jgi:integrase
MEPGRKSNSPRWENWGSVLGGLTVLKVKALSEPGMYGDGGGLYLCVGPGNAKSWVLRTTVFGRRREFGLGSASLVTLAEAREEALRLRKIARSGGNPETERQRETLNFEEAAEQVYREREKTWKNQKHRESWIASVRNYANPVFGKRPIHTVSTADIIKVLLPIWIERQETAKRLRQRLATIFDWAKGHGYYLRENPVNGVEKALPTVKAEKEHLPALPWQDVPAFVKALREREGVSARALEFLILTAVRSVEAREARWEEVDAAEQAWVIPGERMKRGITHRVPLSPAALAILDQMRGLDMTVVFPSATRDKRGNARPMSDAVFRALFDRMGVTGITVHGFRTSFRVWCSEVAHADWDVAETALSHAAGNQVARAYARSDLFDRRRELMNRWADYVCGEASEGTDNGQQNESVAAPPKPKPKRAKLAKHREKL